MSSSTLNLNYTTAPNNQNYINAFAQQNPGGTVPFVWNPDPNGTGTLVSPMVITSKAPSPLSSLLSSLNGKTALVVDGNLQVSGGTDGLGNMTMTGTSTLLSINGTTSGTILLGSGSTFGDPSFTTRSNGAKLVLYPQLSSTSADYAIGVGTLYNMWFGVPSTTQQFIWYGGTTQLMALSGAGTMNVTGGLVLTGTSPRFGNQAAQPSITFPNSSNYYLDQYGNYHFGTGQSGGSWGVISDTSSTQLNLLTVAGTTGNVQYRGTLTQMSDLRLKTDVAEIEDRMLESLLQLRPVGYVRRDEVQAADEVQDQTGKRPHVKRQMGLIAQEVMQVLPDIVHQEAQGEGLYSVAYTELIAPMVKLLQKQQQQLQTQQQQLQAQQQQIDELKGLVRQLIQR